MAAASVTVVLIPLQTLSGTELMLSTAPGLLLLKDGGEG